MLFQKAVCIRMQMYLMIAKEMTDCKSNFTLDLDKVLIRKGRGSTLN